MFDLFFTAESKKFLKKLNRQDSKRIISTLERCRIRPYSHVKKLVSSPYFRLRVGNYRVILNIREGKLLIIIVEIGHRKIYINNELKIKLCGFRTSFDRCTNPWSRQSFDRHNKDYMQFFPYS